MRRAIYAAPVFLLAFLTAVHAQQQTGVYTMYVGGNPASTESYTITAQADGAVKAEAEITVKGPKQKMTTVVSKERPASFTAQVGDSKVISAVFDGAKVMLHVAGRDEREVTSKATVILENGVWHQYIFLLNQYRADKDGPHKGEPQSFTAFLPSQGIDFDGRIERVSSQTYTVKGQAAVTDRYRLTMAAGIVIDTWTDQSRAPLLFVLESQGVKVVRSGSEELAEAIMKPAANDEFTSEEVTFPNGDITLGGTLTLPKTGAARHPAAVIISGSGSQDRDGSMSVLGLYKKIAELLSRNGVAVLRHDDRGVGKSLMPKKPTAYRDVINDSKAAVEYLRGRKDIDADRVMLIGHSEGGMTAAVIASEDQKIAAIILLAGATLATLDKLLLEQIVYQKALESPFNPQDREKYPPIVTWLLARIEEAKSGKPDATPNDVYEYLRQHIALNLAETYRRVKCPVLILQGERDVLALPHHAIDAARVLAESGNKRVLLRIFPNLSHVFTPSPLDAGIEAAKKSEISPEFLDTIQKWARETLEAKPSK